jgi:hypothetical protein
LDLYRRARRLPFLLRQQKPEPLPESSFADEVAAPLPWRWEQPDFLGGSGQNHASECASNGIRQHLNSRNDELQRGVHEAGESVRKKIVEG